MGRRGPQPKPTALKILAGNPGKRPLNDAEPQHQPAAIEPPADLDEVARQFWTTYAPVLSSAGCLTTADIPKFTAACRYWARWKKADAEGAALGPVVRGQNGVAMRNTYFVEADKAWEAFSRIASEFGMSPSARSAIKISDAAPKSRLQAFVKSRGQSHG